MNNNLNTPKIEDLVTAIFEHPDAPYWLLDGLTDVINDNATIKSFDPAYVRVMMSFTPPKTANERAKNGGRK